VDVEAIVNRRNGPGNAPSIEEAVARHICEIEIWLDHLGPGLEV
jgi:hypothetical protein